MPKASDYANYNTTVQLPSYVAPKKYNLTDLREDEEFNKVTERFLTSLGEGEDVGDLFGYFRGADYNLVDGIKMANDSGKFNTQQKQDYQYLRGKFDNANVGGIGEWARAGANAAFEVVSDPTMLASAFFIPWTGGTSGAARIAASKAVQTTLKKLTNKNIAKGVKEGVAKIPGQKLKTPLSKKAVTTIASIEGFAYGSTASFTKQSTDVNTDRRKEISPEEILATGALTGALPIVFRGAGAGYSKFNKSVSDRRNARIDGNEDYKLGVADKLIEKSDALVDAVTPNVRKLTAFVNKPTSLLLKKMEESEQLGTLVKYFRYDADRSITDKGYNLANEMSKRSFYEDVQKLVGTRSEELRKILDPLKTVGTVTVPRTGSRDAFFKVPFTKRASTKLEKQSYKTSQRISDNVNDALAYYLRTNRKTVNVKGKNVSLEKAFNLKDKNTADIITAGTSVRKFMRDIRKDAKLKGLEIGNITNYLPRSFSYSEVKDEIINLEKLMAGKEGGKEGKLVKELKAKEGFKTNEDVLEMLKEIQNPSTVGGKSYSELATTGKGATRGAYFSKKTPALTKQRKLTNIDENNVVDYLDNNVENLLNDYVHQSSGFIQRKAGLGEDLDEFITRFIKPIRAELKEKGSDLTTQEIKRLEDIYLVTTGQVQQIDTPILRTLSDIAIVGNQLALLPLATVTSLPEIAVVLVKGAGKKGTQKSKLDSGIGAGGIRTMWDTADDYRKMWWNDVWTKEMADARPDALKELNMFGRAMNRAGEDRSLAMYGQGFSRRSTQAQNAFFKMNLLHDWTRFVQLTSFNVGKSKMYENLNELATQKVKKKRKFRLEKELNELGVDIEAGKKWVKSGGDASGVFYNENFLPSAARYVDEVIMNPTAAANQKPLWHSMPSSKWAFGLMGFPTAFSNTVLKNAAREVSRDMRSGQVKGMANGFIGGTTMITIAMFGNTIRSGGKNLDEIESGEKELGTEIFDAAVRTGLLGPTEQLYRTQKGLEYDNFASSILKRFTGPAVDDIFRFFEDWNGPLTFGVDEVPGIALLRSTNPEAYKEIKAAAKEADIALGLTREKKPKKEKVVPSVALFSTGGLVEGKDDVPYTKDNPADRKNPSTGKPYSDQMARLGLAHGGMTSSEKNKINVYHYLKEKGLRVEAIVAIMANIDKETGVQKTKGSRYEGTFSYTQQEKGNSKTGKGLFQLTTKLHKKGYQNFLKDNNLKDSNEANIDYFLETIINPKSKMRNQIGGKNLDDLRESFNTGTTQEITEAINNKWLKPDTYGKRIKNEEAHLANLKDRNLRAVKLTKEVTLFNEQFSSIPEKDLRYLPTNVNRRLKNFTKTNSKIYLPAEEAVSLKREIAAEKMSGKALRNDPQGRGFHGGDPEFDPRSVTDDPAEIRGRQGLDKYGTRPKIYRATDSKAAVFYDKYASVDDSNTIGRLEKGTPSITGGYMPQSDELLLSSTKENSMKEVTEPHEYMHRGLKNNNLTYDQEHDYIDKAFKQKERQDFKLKIKDMNPEQLAKYRNYLVTQKNKLLNRE